MVGVEPEEPEEPFLFLSLDEQIWCCQWGLDETLMRSVWPVVGH